MTALKLMTVVKLNISEMTTDELISELNVNELEVQATLMQLFAEGEVEYNTETNKWRWVR